MSFKQQSSNHSHKKSGTQEQVRKVEPSAKNFKNTSTQAKEFKLFQSGRMFLPKNSKDVELSGNQKTKISQKVFTTDESNNQLDSNMHQSIYVSQKQPNEQYFQQPLSFKPKKYKGLTSKRQLKTSKLQNLNAKLSQMNQLVRSQDKQLKQMKNSMSERELHRLIKIHSTQKLKLLGAMNIFKNSGLKNTKKG